MGSTDGPLRTGLDRWMMRQSERSQRACLRAARPPSTRGSIFTGSDQTPSQENIRASRSVDGRQSGGTGIKFRRRISEALAYLIHGTWDILRSSTGRGAEVLPI